jgi:hypothetical protein
MEPSTSSPWNLSTNNSNLWLNGGSRKRKVAVTDLDEKPNQKMFVTEEKMVKEMQTLSLELTALNHVNTAPNPTSTIEEDLSIDDEEDNHEKKETHIEMHQLLKDRLKNDDLQDNLLTKLCENERKKLSMQIVPYMPIHPAQLNNDNTTTTDDENQVSNDTDDHLFKIPSIPTPYTVEEPCDSAIKRGSTMKRSFSQSDQYNTNLSVTELKLDGNDYLNNHQSQSAYFIVEPTTTNLSQTTSSSSNSSLSSGGPSLRITEFIENPTSNTEFTSTLNDDYDDIDMQSVASSDAGDKMDDD